MKKKLFLAAAIVVVATLTALVFATPRATPEEPLPNPNGYDDFVKAAALINRNSPAWQDIENDALRALVATNQPALALIRAGLAKQCRVVPWEANQTNATHLEGLGASKAIAQAFAAASRLALVDGKTNEAAILALDCIRYGTELPRGGVLIDYLVGIAIQSIGRARLEEALPDTDSATSQKVVATLEDVVSRRELSADIWKREAQWARRGRFGPVGLFSQMFQPFLQRGMKAKAEQKFARILTDLQRTKLHAAARAYELEHGQPPATARDLVPQYLKSVPLDPATGGELPLN